jgi:hypothetical protein
MQQEDYQRLMHAQQQQAQAQAIRAMASQSPAFNQQMQQQHQQHQQQLSSSLSSSSPPSSSNWQQQQQQQQQQHQQQQLSSSLSSSSPPSSSNWQQQQQQQQVMQMGHGGAQNNASSYAISPAASAGLGAASFTGSPSPSSGQGWQPGPGSVHYPFSPSPGASGLLSHDHIQTPRHMSATPAPQQQMSLQDSSPSMEPSLSGDFDLFNWGQQ